MKKFTKLFNFILRRNTQNGEKNSDEEAALDMEDEEFLDILDAMAEAKLDEDAKLVFDIENGSADISDGDMLDLYDQQCVADQPADEEGAEEEQKLECENLKTLAAEDHTDADAKERAEIIYRIIRMHKAMANWAHSYISEDTNCNKRDKLVKRISKNRHRMQKKRLAFPTNPLKLKVC